MMIRTWYGAGLIAGVAVFLWGGLAHMVLGLGGESTFKQVPTEAMAAMSANIKAPGLYAFPFTKDPNEMAKLLEKNPYGLMVYAPPGSPFSMVSSLVTQAISDIIAALIAAWIFSMALPSLPTLLSRVGFILALGIFSFMISEVPYWNWYRFPTDFTAFALCFKLTAALIAGIVLALLMGRRSA